jgi:hypothetical protein
MALYNLKREYEERRRQLVEQLQKNPSLDPATQHQIYGAIKEIENFIKTIEYQIASDQEKNLDIELSRAQPAPAVERTKGAIYHVTQGTKKVFTHHIPNTVRKVYDVPKRYFDRKKEEGRLRREIEDEMRKRREVHQAQLNHTTEHVMLEHPHQELAVKPGAAAEHSTVQHIPETGESGPLPTWNDETVAKTAKHDKKRPKSFVKPKKGKNRPSVRARAKHQHKPHTKDERYNKPKPRRK